MQSEAFLASVRDAALALLPDALRAAQSRIRYGMLQIHYGEPNVHYEVWLVRKTGRIEIGLHFEGEREANQAGANELAQRVLELREFLGPEAEMEEWSPSWTRLHLTVPLGSLDSGLSALVATRLATLMQLTGEQVLRIPARTRDPAPSSRHERGGRWRRRRGFQAARG